jgi:hypothetical protein
MLPASSDASMLAVAVPAPLHPTLLAVHSYTRQHANLLVPGQIVSGIVLVDRRAPRALCYGWPPSLPVCRALAGRERWTEGR